MHTPSAHAILTCEQARAFEARFFGGDEAREWAAMQQAGAAVARAARRDFRELGEFPATARLLVLVGKGHNGGDALLAAHEILATHPAATAEIVFVYGARALRPLAQRAWQQLQTAMPSRVAVRTPAELAGAYTVSLDGVFGFQFRPPLDATARAALHAANALPVRMRVAVDLPSGLDEADAFRADFTYATGIVKTPALACAHSGRVRYLDLGFPLNAEPAAERVLTADTLAPLAGWRPASSDKRTFGHVLLLGGSRSYPGAILMATLAALRAGAGLVTACVPESLVPAYAARAPEAMWVGWPETPDGNLALEGLHLLRERLPRVSALVIGPGLGREPETQALVAEIVKLSPVPLVLDADALQPELVRLGTAPRILTPHAGEYARIAGTAELSAACRELKAVIVAKGPVTRIGHGETVWHSLAGGPVLARGGSGDLLAGLIGGLLAQAAAGSDGENASVLPALRWAACAGALWHGRAADALARAQGQTSVQLTALLDHLPEALREAS